MTAPVRIDALAWGDLRFATLARLCGFADAEHALIKCAKIWSWQTEHYTDESPTYVVEVDLVESALGAGGADHLVRARLAEAGPDGLRIRGAVGRIEWLWKRRGASARGGEATKRKHADKQGPSGPVMAEPQAWPEQMPKQGPLTLPLSLVPEIPEINTRARERHPAAGGIARRVLDYGAKARAKLAESSVVVPSWPAMPDASHTGVVALLDRICERLVDSTPEQAEERCRNRIDVAAAKARADGDGNRFGLAQLFTRASFDTFAELDPKQFGQRVRAGPKRAGALIGPASPRADHPDNPTGKTIPISEL